MDLSSRLAYPRSQLNEISSLVHSCSFKLLKLSSIIYFSKIFTLQKIIILCVNNRMLHVLTILTRYSISGKISSQKNALGKKDASFIRRVLNKTQTIPYKRQIPCAVYTG